MRVVAAGDLTLVPQMAAHASEMFLVLGDPAIYEFENEPPSSVGWLHDRFLKLESRRSPDGTEHWLNWVVRLPDSRLAGYVQATTHADGHCFIAYILASAYWGKGYANRCVEAMMAELAGEYRAHTFWAMFKERNFRSRRLLERLGFSPATPGACARNSVEPDEALMFRPARAKDP